MSLPVVLPVGDGLVLGSAFGIELEYMIVDRATLAVRPMADELLRAFTGGEPTDFQAGPVAWSNELALHVIELKTAGPTPSLAGWSAAFVRDLRRIDAELAKHGAMLLPGAMHPTMDPRTETVLWPHEYREVYRTYDRIFNCRQHGWANLQSCHLNLPFDGDDEFERLHAAVRVVLPLLPALAASSPVVEGRATGVLDRRVEVYLTHQARIPEAMGAVVPEVIRSRAEYDERIFAPLREAARRLDPDGVLRPEFLNARGAIARFDRGAIEIRLLDVQETPRMDLAIALVTSALTRALAEERWAPLGRLHGIETDALVALLRRTMTNAERAEVEDPDLLAVLGRRGPLVAQDLWRELASELRDDDDPAWRELAPSLGHILREGSLARRLAGSLGRAPDRELVDVTWGRMARGLTAGDAFS